VLAERIIKQLRDAREVGNAATVETSSVECLIGLIEARDCIGLSCRFSSTYKVVFDDTCFICTGLINVSRFILVRFFFNVSVCLVCWTGYMFTAFYCTLNTQYRIVSYCM